MMNKCNGKKKKNKFCGRPKQPPKEGLHLTNWGSAERIEVGNGVEWGLSLELIDI